MEKKELILATCGFPWGKGEKTFIIPELIYLQKEYNITIIANVNDKIARRSEWITEVDNCVKVIRYNPDKVSVKKKILGSIRALFSPLMYKEIIKLIKQRDNIMERLVESIGYYVFASEYARWAKRKGIIKENVQVVFYSYWSIYFHLAAIMLKKEFQNLKVISRMHGMDLYNERYKGGRQPFKWKEDEESDVLIFASEYGKQYFLSHFAQDVRMRKYMTCKLGIDGVQINCKHNDERVWHLVSCSNVIPLKRVNLIVEGLSQLHDIPIEWTHFGDGEEILNVKKLADEKLPSNIKVDFKGYVSNEVIRNHYKTEYVDCFITTSSTEGGCPVSIMEAMSASVPIIGTDVGGISEMINNNGILLSSNPTKEEVANALREIYEMDIIAIERMREQSMVIWKNNYDIKKNALAVLDVINELY